MCLDVLDPADPGRSDICSLRRLIYSAAVGMASLASTLRFRLPSPGGPTLQQPHSVTSLVSDWQYLHTWFCPVDPLPPSALALCPAVLAFFRLRFAPFLLSRHAEEDFWQRFGQQFNAPHSSFTALALNKLSSSSSSSSLNKYIPSHRMVTSRSHGPQEGQDGPHGE